MSTDTFRRHAAARVEVVTRAAFASLHGDLPRRACFAGLVFRMRPRCARAVAAARNLVELSSQFVRDPDEWPGAEGHVLRVVDSLARHLFGRYPTPRFLASAWFGTRPEACAWFVAHARGERFRSLALPFPMTRKMEHHFLRTPDHYTIDQALRRAEVLAVGGTPALADAILRTQLAFHFEDAERWREIVTWLARCGDDVELVQLRPLIDFLHANNLLELTGRTFASTMRLVNEWHGWRADERAPLVRWRSTGWNPLVVPISGHGAAWSVVELLDSRELTSEGRRMQHCVAQYLGKCVSGRSSIWSLRRRWDDEEQGDGPAVHSVLTIEVRPATRTITQIRMQANGTPKPWQLELVQQWAAREGIRFES